MKDVKNERDVERDIIERDIEIETYLCRGMESEREGVIRMTVIGLSDTE